MGTLFTGPDVGGVGWGTSHIIRSSVHAGLGSRWWRVRSRLSLVMVRFLARNVPLDRWHGVCYNGSMRRKIRIVNKTNWSTRDLRRFVVEAARREFGERGDNRSLNVTFTYVRHRDRHGSSGYAWYNTGSSVIRVGRVITDKIDLAKVLCHEFAHNRGVTHAEMRGSALYRRIGNWRELAAWGEALPLTWKAPKVKAKVSTLEHTDSKLVQIQASIDRWQSKLKRAQTALKKYQRKAAYYQKKKAAAMKPLTGGMDRGKIPA